MVNQMREEVKAKRRKQVLEMIVRYYTTTAEPVGSHLISKDIGVSSATIRNIMFELEGMGLIRQPHISAGRIPTDKGYRSYVDSLMGSASFLVFDEAADETVSCLRADSLEDVILKGLELCSRLTTQVCIALFPTLKIRKHLAEGSGGGVRDALTSLYDFEDRLYLDGTHYLAEQPEFKDVRKISSFLRVLENKKILLEVLEEDSKDRSVKTHIGSENDMLGFDECTLITANYNIEDDIAGRLGIIGPVRMQYERVIPMVDRVARSISRLFSEMFR